MSSDEEMAELRYEETMDAIGIWLDGNKGKGSAAETIGIAKAFSCDLLTKSHD